MHWTSQCGHLSYNFANMLEDTELTILLLLLLLQRLCSVVQWQVLIGVAAHQQERSVQA
jgi:hypothetical protein